VHTLETGNRSPALNTVFLRKRASILEQFLVDTCVVVCTTAAEPVPLAPAGGPEEVPMTIAGKRMVH
jgi:hypothetical protein